MPRDEATVEDMYRAARMAREFAAGADEGDFLRDRKTQAAVLHELLIIGEAAKRLSEEFRRSHPSMPWKAMAGMRDKLIHAYDTVDIEEVWSTVQRDIPTLLAYLAPLLPDDNKQ